MQEQSIEAEELRRQNKRLAERNLEKDDLIAQLNKELSVSRQEIEKLKNENSDIMIKMEKAEEQVDEVSSSKRRNSFGVAKVRLENNSFTLPPFLSTYTHIYIICIRKLKCSSPKRLAL